MESMIPTMPDIPPAPAQPSADKLVDLWMHENRLAWSRVQTAIALHAALIFGWYYSMTDDLPQFAAPLALLGVALTAIMLFLLWLDSRARSRVRSRLRENGARLPFDTGGRGGTRLALTLALVVFIACDGIMAGISLKYPHCMAAQQSDGDSYDSTSNHILQTAHLRAL